MDQNTALELVKKGASLLLLDVPQLTLVGIDTQVFVAGPNFRGIKMIPPGPHFIYYNASSMEGNVFSPTTGFFIRTSFSEVVVRRWHQQEEILLNVTEDEEVRYSEGVKNFEFDHSLGPYALESFGEWKQLSNYISKTTVERIEPIGGEITVTYDSELVDEIPTTTKRCLVRQLKNASSTKEDLWKRGCYYTPIPHIIKKRNTSSGELTALNIDKTKLLETILLNDFGGSEDLILGELQFAFIAFMMGQSLQAFFQWKALISLFFGCIEAPIHTRSQLFCKFIRVVYCELKYGFEKGENCSVAADNRVSVFLDDSWLSKDTFLYQLCKDFFPIVLESPVIDGALLSLTRKLKMLLESTLGWRFEDFVMDAGDETDEYAPAIVLPDEAVASQKS